MVADGMLTRKRYREVPPRVDYELTERSRELAPVLGELARWGYEWAWSPPRSQRARRLGAIFRLVAGAADLPDRRAAPWRLTVAGRSTDGETEHYALTVKPASSRSWSVPSRRPTRRSPERDASGSTHSCPTPSASGLDDPRRSARLATDRADRTGSSLVRGRRRRWHGRCSYRARPRGPTAARSAAPVPSATCAAHAATAARQASFGRGRSRPTGSPRDVEYGAAASLSGF